MIYMLPPYLMFPALFPNILANSPDLSRALKVNPDNVATPIAASLGDVTTLSLLAWIANILFNHLEHKMFTAQIIIGSVAGGRSSLLSEINSWHLSTNIYVLSMYVSKARHFGSYKAGKLWGTRYKGGNSAVQFSKLSWKWQYKKCVLYDFKFTSVHSEGCMCVWCILTPSERLEQIGSIISRYKPLWTQIR